MKLIFEFPLPTNLFDAFSSFEKKKSILGYNIGLKKTEELIDQKVFIKMINIGNKYNKSFNVTFSKRLRLFRQI